MRDRARSTRGARTTSRACPCDVEPCGADHTLCKLPIVKKSLTKPDQFERSPANIRSAWLLTSRVSGRDGRDDIMGVDHESPSCSELCRRHPRLLQPGS